MSGYAAGASTNGYIVGLSGQFTTDPGSAKMCSAEAAGNGVMWCNSGL